MYIFAIAMRNLEMGFLCSLMGFREYHITLIIEHFSWYFFLIPGDIRLKNHGKFISS